MGDVRCILNLVLLVAGLVAQDRVAPAVTSTSAETIGVRIRARVCDAAGQPLKDVCVLVGQSDELTTQAALKQPHARSNGSGAIDFVLMVTAKTQPTREALLLAAPGKVGMRIPCRDLGLLGAKQVGKEWNLGEIRLPDGFTVSGRVRDPDGKPIVGARIQAMDGLQPYPWIAPTFGCIAATNERGVFSLPGVFANAMSFAVFADGFYTKEIPSVGFGSPLDIQLQRSGFVEGVVHDASDQALVGTVMLSREFLGADPEPIPIIDGKFRIPVRLRGRFRVSASNTQGTVVAESDLLDGPTGGVAIRQDRSVVDAFVVRAVDAITGESIPHIRASAMWFTGEMKDGFKSMLRVTTTLSIEDGKVYLGAAGEHDSSKGLLHVAADGYAPFYAGNVQRRPGQDYVAELSKGASLAGTVVDAATGKVAPGMRVTCLEEGRERQNWEAFTGAEMRVLTGDDGSFWFGGLEAGSYELVARRADGTVCAKKLVKVKVSEAQTWIELQVPNGVKVTGKVSGELPHAGCMVLLTDQLEPEQTWVSDVPGKDYEGAVPLVDGTFRFEHRASGSEHLLLLVPPAPRHGAILRIPLAKVTIGKEDIDLAVDLAPHLPGSIAGVVKVNGANLSRTRLVVVAAQQAEQVVDPRMPASADRQRWSLVEPDGRYRIELPPGGHTLLVVDSATGVVLLSASEPVKIVAAQGTTQKLQVDVVEVRAMVHFDGGPSASRIRILRPDEDPNDFQVALFGGGQHGTVGFNILTVDLPVSFFVPPGTNRLHVESGATRIARGRIVWTGDKLQEHVFEAELGRVSEIALELPKPDEIEIK